MDLQRKVNMGKGRKFEIICYIDRFNRKNYLYLCKSMSKKFIFNILGVFIVLIVTSCDPYQKLLKSSDYDLKYKKAKEYYNTGEYYKALPLLEELMTIYKGTKNTEKLYYFYAYSHYGQGDYIFASHYFQRFVNLYPKSIYTEDAQFMIGYCFYKMSPVVSLEQTNTQKALESLQLFITKYPESEKLARCNELIDELRQKLEIKAVQSAELYFDIRNYKAAATSFNSVLIDFPDTNEKESILFKILKSHYLLAQNSVKAKRMERYKTAVEAYYDFIDKYPKSKFAKEAEKIYASCQENIKKL